MLAWEQGVAPKKGNPMQEEAYARGLGHKGRPRAEEEEVGKHPAPPEVLSERMQRAGIAGMPGGGGSGVARGSGSGMGWRVCRNCQDAFGY